MEPHTSESAAPAPAVAEPSLSVWQRTVAVFVRPNAAWGGLTSRAQWWFPFVLMLLVSICFTLVLYHHAILPMIQDSWDQAIADGKMTAEQVDRASSFMSGPAGVGISLVQTLIVLPIILLLTALAVWFAVGFLLGSKFRFRLAMEAVCWASLITIPGQILTGVIAWSRETMKGVHVGFGALLPMDDPPSKLQAALGFFLDRIGPLELWYLAVLILGAAALSGAPRKRTMWAVGGVYMVIMLFIAVITFITTKGS
jgi:hypothetical protein